MYAHLFKTKGCTCWAGYERVPGTKPCAPNSCRPITKAESNAQAMVKDFASKGYTLDLTKATGSKTGYRYWLVNDKSGEGEWVPGDLLKRMIGDPETAPKDAKALTGEKLAEAIAAL